MKIEAKNLNVGYGSHLVIDGIELFISQGSIVTLVGPNGCGKSTLLKTLGRLLKPWSGQVLLDGKSIHELNTRVLAQKLAILPQLHHTSGEITVGELVGFGRYPHHTGLGVMNANDLKAIEEALRLTHLETLRGRKMSTLSGGERQRAWIAMTLAQEPQLLLLDEPTTFLDIRYQFEIIELIQNLNQRLGLTVLMVLHDLNLAARCSDQLVVLKDHQVRHAGPPAEIICNEILQEVFEIQAEIHTGQDGIPYFIPTGTAPQPN